MECLHQHDWFEDFEHQRQSRVKKQRGGEEMLGQSRAEMEQSIGRQELEKEKSCRVWWMLQTLIYELQDRGLWELGGEIIAIFAT